MGLCMVKKGEQTTVLGVPSGLLRTSNQPAEPSRGHSVIFCRYRRLSTGEKSFYKQAGVSRY